MGSVAREVPASQKYKSRPASQSLLFGRDPMQRKFDEHIASYRAPPSGDNNREVPY
jgi:hypothetical protein